jgi:hypothetical protein
MYRLPEVWIDNQKNLFQRTKKGYTPVKAAEGSAYYLELSASSIELSADGLFTPASFVVKSKFQDSEGTVYEYAGRIRISYSTNGFEFTLGYSSVSDEASHTYSLSEAALVYRFELFQAGGTSLNYFSQDVAVITEASVSSIATEAAAAAIKAGVIVSASGSKLVRSRTGVFDPTTITFSAATSDGAAYSGIFRIYEDIAGVWMLRYTSSSEESSHIHTPSAGATAVRAKFFKYE